MRMTNLIQSRLSLSSLLAIAALATTGLGSACPATPTPNDDDDEGGGGEGEGEGPAALALSLLAGDTGGIGNIDGPRDAALFFSPSGVAVVGVGLDSALFVADASSSCIKKVQDDVVSTIAGRCGERGTDDGDGEDARFLLPVSIVADDDGTLYVGDSEAATVRRLTPNDDDGSFVVDTFVGIANLPGAVDGPRGQARLAGPEGLALDADGDLYIADRAACTIRKVDIDAADADAGDVSTLVGVAGDCTAEDGARVDARLAGPFGVAVNGDGLVAIADSDSNTLRLVDGDVVTTLAGLAGEPQGTIDGDGALARFGRPRALAFWPDGGQEVLLVADTFNDRIRHVTLAGTVTTWAGSTFGHEDGTREDATMSFPTGFAVAEEDGAPVLYVAEFGTSIVRRITDDAVTLFAGRPADLGYVDGAAADARFFHVSDAVARDDGSVLLVDQVNNVIRLLGTDGVVTRFAGSADGEGGDVDGDRLDARFLSPSHIVADGNGGFFVSDQGNHCIKRIDADGVVTRVAGGPIGRGAALVDGPALEALFFAPSGMAVDDDGRLIIADSGNHAVRIFAGNFVVTMAGASGRPGFLDGRTDNARFNLPSDVLVDGSDVYVADSLNDVIRKIDTVSGAVTVFAGHPPTGVEEPTPGDEDGDGTAAGFRTPRALLRDGDDGFLVADSNNSLVRRVTLDGTVTTSIGTRGSLGVVEGALPGSLFEPQGLGRDPDGNVIVTFQSGVLVVKPIE